MATEVFVTRRALLPDADRLARYSRDPENGPRLLFFGGGTALRDVSRHLVRYTHNSIHLLTPFDSGGSSAHLRKAFRMLAVGDLRNRLMALADHTVHGQPQIFELFAFRFPRDGESKVLLKRLRRMAEGIDPLVAAVEDPMRKIIRNHLRLFLEQMPASFDLRGANIGNLILTGGYLNQKRHIDPVVFLFSKLVEVRGVVRPVASSDLHLATELENGNVLVGQHLLTRRGEHAIKSPVSRVFLTKKVRRPEPVNLELRGKVRDLLRSAEAICYPMGSFYSSLIASLLPHGIGETIAELRVPKVYVPNTGDDPEQLGLSLSGAVEQLLEYLRAGCRGKVDVADLLQYVLLDVRGGEYRRREIDAVRKLGVEIVDVPLVTPASQPYWDADRLSEVLVSLV